MPIGVIKIFIHKHKFTILLCGLICIKKYSAALKLVELEYTIGAVNVFKNDLINALVQSNILFTLHVNATFSLGYV